MTDQPATFREVFAVQPFRVLFLSRSVAIGADTFRLVALSILVFSLTGSALWSAVTFGIGFLPQVVGGMFLASYADRVRPRPLIVTGYLLAAGVALVLATVHLPIAVALGLVALQAVFSPIFNGASNRLISEVLTGDSYVLGRSLATISSGAAQLIGMAFGGLAVAALGPRQALFVSAFCLLAAAAGVRLRLGDFPIAAGPGKHSAIKQTWSTNVTLWRNRNVRRLLLIQWLPPAFVVGGEGLLVAYAAHRGFPPGAAGLMLAAAPAGMLLGDLIVGRFLRPSMRTRLVTPLIVLLGLPLVLLAMAPPLAAAIALVGASCAGFAYMLGLQQAFLDAVPAGSRGQAFSLHTTGLMTLQGLGPVAVGGLAQLTSIPVGLAAAGAATVVTALVWAFLCAPPRLRLSAEPSAAPRAAHGS